MSFTISQRCLACSGILFFLFAVGCTPPTAKSMIESAADSNVKKLGALYLQFQLQNTEESLIGPADENEFKDFIRRQSETGLDFLGVDVDNLDQMFVSERDNKPLKVRWSVKGNVRGPAIPIFFEQDGIDGTYEVGFNGFVSKQVDKAEYDRMWAGELDADEGA